MTSLQPIYNIAEICFQKGIRNVVLCPGSRCAPLTLAFTRHGQFSVRVFSDERSAAFIALGIAQQTKQPVVLICTSGSAVYNFAPAVAEAFFSNTPLLVISADRPAEWIGQHDGQTIFQNNIFGNHVKHSYVLPQEYSHLDNEWVINRITNEAINLCIAEQAGPVHINAPFREPLYPKDQAIQKRKAVRIIKEDRIIYELSEHTREQFHEHWQKSTKVLIVCGQEDHSPALSKIISAVSEKHSITIVGDILSNQHGLLQTIRYSDSFLTNMNDSDIQLLQPELLISLGKSVISKNLKLFLRTNKPIFHWHVQSSGAVADAFQGLTTIARTTPEIFFSFLNSLDTKPNIEKQKTEKYKSYWQTKESKCIAIIQNHFPHKLFGECEALKEILNRLPPHCNLHLANSMSVRYANLIGLHPKQNNVRVYANRGTSGIDGCTSTAVGHCLADPQILNFLITGDIAFFYDRNAFWHNYALPNLRIILLNNHGGIIFKMIDGPSDLPEADDYFVTHQKLTAKKLCEDHHFEHTLINNHNAIKNISDHFFEFGKGTKILEIESDNNKNKTIFEELKNKLKNQYDS